MSVNYAIHYGMSARQRNPGVNLEALSKLLQRAIDETGMSVREIARRAGVSHGTLNNIRNQNNKSEVRIETLKALPKAIPYTEKEILAAAYGEQNSDEIFHSSPFYEMSLQFERLPEDEKIDMQPILNMVKKELQRRGRTKPNK